MIDRLIDALNIEMDLSVEEIADTIWLALQIQPESGAIAPAVEEEFEESDRPFLERDEEISESSFSQREEVIKKGQKEAGIYPPTPAKTAVSVDMSLKIPDAPSLRSPLHLVRGLKPLMRRVSSGRDAVLDEAKTSQNIAETGVWLPVLKPTLEPWLDLELVVDESLSMHLWRRAIAEWVRLLRNYGIFRNVRVWGLLVEEGRVSIRRGIGGIGKNQRFRSPDELVNPTGRGLVLVVSDCVSSFWREGKMVAVLDAWGKRQPMAIAQMLPRWLWGRTSLGRGATVRLRGLSPGVANGALLSEAVSLWDGEGGIKVPVLTLEAERAAIWAQMVAGKGVWCSEVAFARARWRERSEREGSDRSTAADRVQGFRVTASPMARKLAGLLASAPVITLPVVRLIREQCLRESQQVHVAEVFLGGLLKPLTEIDADTNPDIVRYDFIEGVRELLIESVPSSYVLDVVDKVSQFIARRLGLSLENFAAVLKNPQEFSDGRIIEEVRPFAMVTAQVLRCLGGEYARFAEELKEEFKTKEEPQNQTVGFSRSTNTDSKVVETNALTEILNKPVTLMKRADRKDPFTLKEHTNHVTSVAIHPDGKTFATGSLDKRIILWDLETREVKTTCVGTSSAILSLNFSPDGKILASSSNMEFQDSTIKLWDSDTLKFRDNLDSNLLALRVSCIAFSPDGLYLASGNIDATIKIWNLSTGKILHTLRGHGWDVHAVSFSHDGQLLVSGSLDGAIKIWSWQNARLLNTLIRPSPSDIFGSLASWLDRSVGSIWSITISPDKKLLVSGDSDGSIKMWDIQEIEKARLIKVLTEHSQCVYTLAFSPDGDTLASGSKDQTIRIWDSETGKLLQTLKGHSGAVRDIAFSPNGQTLISVSEDRTVKVWKYR